MWMKPGGRPTAFGAARTNTRPRCWTGSLHKLNACWRGSGRGRGGWGGRGGGARPAPGEGELPLTNRGSVLRVTGRLGTHVGLICDRCARSFRYPLKTVVREELDWGGTDGVIITDGQGGGLDLDRVAG